MHESFSEASAQQKLTAQEQDASREWHMHPENLIATALHEAFAPVPLIMSYTNAFPSTLLRHVVEH
jgi:hypothetical protein